MSDERGLLHVTAECSLWSGRITAVCGVSAEAGGYEVFHVFGFGPRCPDCRRLSDRDA
ncbi:hypothetical protein ATK36_6346 [Amycolatopsis sulphurea]|uniref:Uncharacterized protein n=1 Tax=Amycolatopsis sulphurea TaxID=76022 RepID=A0A2A9FJG0_9PSEU|nr:hypothetical protein ATK36_6346 [Amycolatopsis sulphurea]